MPQSPAPRTGQARARKCRASRFASSGSLGKISEVEIDRERDDANEAQPAADALPPQLDRIDRSVRPGRVASREVIGRPFGSTRQRGGREGIALAKRFQRPQRLAPLLLL